MLFARQNSPSTALPSLSMSRALQNLAFQHSSNHAEIGVIGARVSDHLGLITPRYCSISQ